MKKTRTLVTFVLDETGSMESIKDDVIGGFNQYVRTLKESDENVRFSLIKFDSNRVQKVHVDTAIANVRLLTAETYRPGAATPLIDASVKAIKATETKARVDDKVIVVIQTDGLENASREYKQEDLVDLIAEKTKAGWVFLFLGVGIDAFATARSYGIAAGQTMMSDRNAAHDTMAVAAAATMDYATTGTIRDFTEAERARTGGYAPDGGKIESRPVGSKAPPRHKVVKTSPRKIVKDFTL